MTGYLKHDCRVNLNKIGVMNNGDETAVVETIGLTARHQKKVRLLLTLIIYELCLFADS